MHRRMVVDHLVGQGGVQARMRLERFDHLEQHEVLHRHRTASRLEFGAAGLERIQPAFGVVGQLGGGLQALEHLRRDHLAHALEWHPLGDSAPDRFSSCVMAIPPGR